MHEVGIAAEIVHSVLDRLEKGELGGRRVAKVTVRVGALTAVLPDALTFAFDLLREDTELRDATLVIERVPAKARCRACGAVTEKDGPFGLCACGAMDLDWLSGEELAVSSLTLSDPSATEVA